MQGIRNYDKKRLSTLPRSFSMKYVFVLLFMLFGTLHANEYKAVFDCSSGDANYIKTRMWLIGKTMSMIEKSGDKANFVITLHGSCVPMISKNYDFIVKEKDVANTKQAQEYLRELAQKRGVKVIACAMSLASNAIDKEDVLKFVHITPNSFIDTIAYQNSGYAIMTFK
ncbi:MAG: DsrE family protein [Sulfurimonas sp.]|nr:DsrE family protein [Sulfurimonas sp.]MDD3835042.1 DsrE family protein [Sulfurimonas sp.]